MAGKEKKETVGLTGVNLKDVVKASVAAFMANVTGTVEMAMKKTPELVENAAKTSDTETIAVGGISMVMLQAVLSDENFLETLTEMVGDALLATKGERLDPETVAKVKAQMEAQAHADPEEQPYVRPKVDKPDVMYG